MCMASELPTTGLQERLKKLNPEQLAELHPRVSERMARDSDGIRNRLEEARRMNIDEMRELQRFVGLCQLLAASPCTVTCITD